MKRTGILICSLGLNLLLAGAIAWAVYGQQHSLLPDGVKSSPITTATLPTTDAISVSETLGGMTNEVVTPFDWGMVESTDYLAYMTNLRAVGCPEQRIRDIIIADVDDLFIQRARDYILPLQAQFWHFAAQPRDVEKNLQTHVKVLEQLNEERERIFQMLFNETNPRRSARSMRRAQARTANRNSELDYLEEAKRAGVIKLQDELGLALSEVHRLQLTGSREEIRSQRTAKETEARQASDEKLRLLLSPEEFAEYKLRNSSGAQVRYQLARMTLTESEAQQMAQIMTAKTDAEGESKSDDPTTKIARAQKEQRAQEQVKQLLGDARYAEYERVTDYRYDQTARITERMKLPEQTTVALYEARRESEKVANRLRADASASAEERAAALNLIRLETENSVRQLIGAEAYQDYQRHSGWLNDLARPSN